MKNTTFSHHLGAVCLYVSALSLHQLLMTQPILTHPTGGPIKPILERIAKARSIDTHTVLYLWQLAMGVLIVTSSSKEANIDKLVEVETLEPLTREQVEEISREGRRVYYRNGKNVRSIWTLEGER